MGSFDGQTAIVTGAAQGIGAAVAELLAARGAQVVVADINSKGGAAVAVSLGEPSFAVPVDVGDEASVAALHEEVVSQGRRRRLHPGARHRAGRQRYHGQRGQPRAHRVGGGAGQPARRGVRLRRDAPGGQAPRRLGAAARLASQVGGTTIAVGAEPVSAAGLEAWGAGPGAWGAGLSAWGAGLSAWGAGLSAWGGELGAWGADQALLLSTADEQAVARIIAARADDLGAWAILAPSTSFGRHVAARVAARLGAGLTGDAVDLGVQRLDGAARMVAWKPAFAGRLVAAITARSPVQLATLRPGVFAPLPPRPVTAALTRVEVQRRGGVQVLAQTRDGGAGPLARAACLIAVGAGVPPDQYGELDRLRELLGAELVGTRKVTDRGWLPRSRQVGLTGHSVGPRLYLALGLSGKFNHLIGARRAGTILAVNSDPSAPVFDGADIGIVGDWRETVPLLTAAVSAYTAPIP